MSLHLVSPPHSATAALPPMRRPSSAHPWVLTASILAATALSLGPGAFAAPPKAAAQPDNATILRKMEELQAKVQSLESRLSKYEGAAPGPAPSSPLKRSILTENITSKNG